MSTVPVRSPLLFYERRGVPEYPRACSLRKLLDPQSLAGLFHFGRRTQRSRDLSLHALPLLALATGCAGTPATGQQHAAFTLPVSIPLLVFGAVLVGFVSGITVGMRQAMTFLRLADAAAW